MRDPNRIPKVLVALAEVWYLNPDLRLGQLVCNAASMLGTGQDPFYTEDDKMLEGLQKHTQIP